MRKATDLLRYSKPATAGKLTLSEWAKLEKELGNLPLDFKELVSTFGLGRFGDLYLFHPLFPLSSRLRLPEACARALNFLKNENSEVIDFALTKYPLPLGHLDARRYLLSGISGWAFIEFDTEEFLEVGESIITFLDESYKSLACETRLTPLAKTIWKSSLDGSQDQFFESQHEL